MATERKHLEVFVGLFILIGFSVIAVMVVTFGRVGQSFNRYYQVTVEFPNAGGLVKDSDVLLAGARIGFVAEAPALVGHKYAVAVKLNVREDVKIPHKSSFLVGSSGLMGDRFVDVVPPQTEFDPQDVMQPDEYIQGSRTAGLDDLTAKGGVVMDQLIAELEEIKKMTSALNDKVLAQQNLKNLEETFANLKTTTANFGESSKKLDPILTDAKVAVETAKQTMKTTDAAAADLRKAIAEFEKTAQTATKTIESAGGLIDSGKALMKKASDGQGALGTLISDKQTAENLRVFLANLRRSGPIFYKDRPQPPPQQQQPSDRAPRR